MVCDSWISKLDAYLDGELQPDEARAVSEHLRGCAACAAESLSRVQMKRAVQVAGQRYVPDEAFRERVQKSIAPKRRPAWSRLWIPAFAAFAVFVIVSGIYFAVLNHRRNDRELLGELADLHVATLASSNPVDVVSTDRHTVKPWFEGKIPFTFNLPELQNTPFTLVGGKVAYLKQSPGAELIFRVRQHQISVFIFQERAAGDFAAAGSERSAQSFTVRSWSHEGLRYFVVGDVTAADLDKLSDLLKSVQ
jgi:anti-sigma factor RsiW